MNEGYTEHEALKGNKSQKSKEKEEERGEKKRLSYFPAIYASAGIRWSELLERVQPLLV